VLRFVLADTGPIYAKAVKKDAEHERAERELTALEAQGRHVLLSQHIILEAHSLLLKRTLVPYAHDYARALTERFHTLNPQSEDYGAARDLAARFRDQRVSLFDATLAVLAERLSLPVWTFDHHFDILGTQVWRPS
jgi:predicted nucleic acid-binding protein